MNAQMATQGSEPVSIGDWIITLIVLAIPLVGLIMLFVWGFSAGTPASKQNYCRAVLVFAVIAIVLGILFMFLFGAALSGLVSHAGGGNF